jgi:hypothetical protein
MVGPVALDNDRVAREATQVRKFLPYTTQWPTSPIPSRSSHVGGGLTQPESSEGARALGRALTLVYYTPRRGASPRRARRAPATPGLAELRPRLGSPSAWACRAPATPAPTTLQLHFFFVQQLSQQKTGVSTCIGRPLGALRLVPSAWWWHRAAAPQAPELVCARVSPGSCR